MTTALVTACHTGTTSALSHFSGPKIPGLEWSRDGDPRGRALVYTHFLPKEHYPEWQVRYCERIILYHTAKTLLRDPVLSLLSSHVRTGQRHPHLIVDQFRMLCEFLPCFELAWYPTHFNQTGGHPLKDAWAGGRIKTIRRDLPGYTYLEKCCKEDQDFSDFVLRCRAWDKEHGQ